MPYAHASEVPREAPSSWSLECPVRSELSRRAMDGATCMRVASDNFAGLEVGGPWVGKSTLEGLQLRKVDHASPDVRRIEEAKHPGSILHDVAGVPADERVRRIDRRDAGVRRVPGARQLSPLFDRERAAF